MSEITLHTTDTASDLEETAALDILRTFTRGSVPALDNCDFAPLLKGENGGLVSCLIAQSRWGGLHVHSLAVSESLRK